MALVRAGIHGINMLADSGYYEVVQANILALDTHLIKLRTPHGFIQEYHGTFGYSQSGALIGGTATYYKESYPDGSLSYDVSDMFLNVSTYQYYASRNDSMGLRSYMLSGNDGIVGGPADDILAGFAGNDAIRGEGGNDIIVGGLSGDRIDGGAGIDTVVMAGPRSAYTVSHVNGYVAVSGGVDGGDTLSTVERIRFTDGTLVVDQSDPVFGVYRLYEAALNRAPDGPGLTAWVNAAATGTTMPTMAHQFMQSSEFSNRYGSPDNASFVNLLYLNVLDRPADGEGAAFWLHGLNAGLATREEVLLGFANSGENIAYVNNAVGDGIWMA